MRIVQGLFGKPCCWDFYGCSIPIIARGHFDFSQCSHSWWRLFLLLGKDFSCLTLGLGDDVIGVQWVEAGMVPVCPWCPGWPPKQRLTLPQTLIEPRQRNFVLINAVNCSKLVTSAWRVYQQLPVAYGRSWVFLVDPVLSAECVSSNTSIDAQICNGIKFSDRDTTRKSN